MCKVMCRSTVLPLYYLRRFVWPFKLMKYFWLFFASTFVFFMALVTCTTSQNTVHLRLLCITIVNYIIDWHLKAHNYHLKRSLWLITKKTVHKALIPQNWTVANWVIFSVFLKLVNLVQDVAFCSRELLKNWR